MICAHEHQAIKQFHELLQSQLHNHVQTRKLHSFPTPNFVCTLVKLVFAVPWLEHYICYAPTSQVPVIELEFVEQTLEMNQDLAPQASDDRSFTVTMTCAMDGGRFDLVSSTVSR